MTQQEKELLLKDLSGRLPYGVKAQYYGSEEEMLLIDTIDAIYREPIEIEIGQYGLPINEVKPYLRPMSSMTEEERRKCYHSYGDVMAERAMSSDYLNSIHVDYRGLIKKGIAIEAPEGMYNL